jgi:mannose-6-phosphate isomerase
MERWELAAPLDAATDPASFEILTAINGAANLSWGDEARHLARGESIVLPASLGAYRLTPESQATLLRCYIP